MMASCLFSLSHWVFCFKYYTAARRLTLLLNNENPKKDDLKLNIVNIIFTALNILIPALYAWSYTVQAKPNQSTVFVWFYVSSTINLFLQFVSLAILSMALYNIKYQIETRSICTMNSQSMYYHYVCFLLFIMATLAFYISDMCHPPPNNLQVHLVTEIIKIASSCALQISLAFVIYMLVIQSALQHALNNSEQRSISTTSVSSYLYSKHSVDRRSFESSSTLKISLD